jgi:hypothetical protein
VCGNPLVMASGRPVRAIASTGTSGAVAPCEGFWNTWCRSSREPAMTSAEPTDVRLFEAGTGHGDRTDMGCSRGGPSDGRRRAR